MADKSEFVDMISEATRQSRRRVMPRVVEPGGQGNLAPQPLAAGPLGQWRHGDADAVEAEILEIQELGLKRDSVQLVVMPRRPRKRRTPRYLALDGRAAPVLALPPARRMEHAFACSATSPLSIASRRSRLRDTASATVSSLCSSPPQRRDRRIPPAAAIRAASSLPPPCYPRLVAFCQNALPLCSLHTTLAGASRSSLVADLQPTRSAS